jgi:hypothetical protein
MYSFDERVTLQDGFLSVLPTASDSILGGVKVGNTLTIDSAGVLNATATIPTSNDQLVNSAGYITSAALSSYPLTSTLSTVATSGDFDDLTNKPTVPTNNNQLTNEAASQARRCRVIL